jgi:hypothetical protein
MCQAPSAPAVTVCATGGEAGDTLLYRGHRRAAFTGS